MNKPALYNASNKIQKNISISTLKEYEKKIKWNKIEDTAIDLGCGDGSLSVLLKNFAPINYKKFVACDVCEEMINFAKKRYEKENISFILMDIAEEVPKNMKGKFNHVFSFYALHWVKDQEKAFSNIYNLISDDGDCFMTFLTTSAIYSVYSVLARHPKWKSWLRPIDLFIGPYHEMKNPEEKVAQIMAKCGFKNIDVTCKKITNVYESVKAVRDFVQSVEPYNMPNELFDEFIQDYISASEDIGVMRIENRNHGEKAFVTDDYLLVAFANK